MKRFFCDVETTGTHEYRHGLVQLSAQALVGDELAFSVDYRMRPFGRDILDPEALEVTGYKEEDIIEWEDPRVIHNRLKQDLNSVVDPYDSTDKFLFIGYNSGFDYNFMRAWFEKNGDDFFFSYFFWPHKDVAQMALEPLKPIRDQMPNFKLPTVCRECGIPFDEEEAHDAAYDIEKTKELYFALHNVFVDVTPEDIRNQ